MKVKTFEEALKKLETIVKELENGNEPLDEAIKKYTEAMELVISMGHDGDTNAAIVGSVLGAKFGFEKIPKQLMKYLYLGNWIYKDLAKMMSAMGVQPLESPFHKLSFE